MKTLLALLLLIPSLSWGKIKKIEGTVFGDTIIKDDKELIKDVGLKCIIDLPIFNTEDHMSDNQFIINFRGDIAFVLTDFFRNQDNWMQYLINYKYKTSVTEIFLTPTSKYFLRKVNTKDNKQFEPYLINVNRQKLSVLTNERGTTAFRKGNCEVLTEDEAFNLQYESEKKYLEYRNNQKITENKEEEKLINEQKI